MAKPLKHILCVDDESDILTIAQMALENIGGFKVSTCNSGKEAVERSAGIKPDMIILDVMMPGLDGPAAIAQLKAMPELKGVPVVFMTASVQSKEIDRYIGLGAIGVIMKPFDPMTLSKEVEALWLKSQG